MCSKSPDLDQPFDIPDALPIFAIPSIYRCIYTSSQYENLFVLKWVILSGYMEMGIKNGEYEIG